MAKKETFGIELDNIRTYLTNDSNEDAKRKLVYPLFVKLFGDKFKTESDAQGADGYVEGKLVLELKTKSFDWLAGFYQALHYAKKGLSFPTVVVISEKFLAVWKLKNIPEYPVILSHQALPLLAPNEVGKDLARRTNKATAQEILDSAIFKLTAKEIAEAQKELRMTYEVFEFLNVLRNLDADRIQVNTHNFIATIEQMKKYFHNPIEAIHAFYTIVGFWDISSTVSETEYGDELRIVGYKGKKMSEPIQVIPKFKKEFIRFIENRYIFTNEGSGLTVDYYFSRFDEVISQLNPEYAKQHGIFFTDDSLSKFALWFVNQYFAADLGENYIVFDPAGGSGNLVSSYRGKLKHKIVSELQPDLLRTIERRMKYDPYHIESGFTIIPKTSENKGLNFLDISAAEYLAELEKALQTKQMKLDKPLAFLLNPPYKNTDENAKVRQSTDAHYEIHPSILALTGEDAGKERYLGFLAQILNICAEQVKQYPDFQPIMMIFTPTSWLIPRPTYQKFRTIFDQYFVFQTGFIVTSNEFFKLDGRWPVAFSIWKYAPSPEGENKPRENQVKMLDFTELHHEQLAKLNWNDSEQIDWVCKQLVENHKSILLNNTRGDIRDSLPKIQKGDIWIKQPMYDFKRDPTKEELSSGKIYGGLPLKDERRNNKKTYGISNSNFIGFMDDCIPVRINIKSDIRFERKHFEWVWFRLDTTVKDINKSKCFGGPTDNRSYCAYDLSSAQATFSWFAITKALNGRYPV
jgi:hypothetical protein